MGTIKIITNNVPRDLLNGWELPEGVWKEHEGDFGYISAEEIKEATHRFFQYKGEWYDINEFTWPQDSPWDGIQHDTFFSATVIRYCNDFESVIVGRIMM